MQEMLTFFAGRLGSFIAWLGGLTVVSGVSLLGLLGALFLVGLLIHNLLLRAR